MGRWLSNEWLASEGAGGEQSSSAFNWSRLKKNNSKRNQNKWEELVLVLVCAYFLLLKYLLSGWVWTSAASVRTFIHDSISLAESLQK